MAAGQEYARFGVAQDRQQTLLMVAARRLRRIRRNGDHPGVQAGKKCRDVVRAAGQQQDRAITHRCIGLQGCGKGPRT